MSTAELSKPDTAVMFAAARDGLRLVKVPRYPIFGPGGKQVGEDVGQTVSFRNGILRVPPEGFTFEDGRRVSRKDTPELLEWLRSHRLAGNVEDGFTEIAQAAPEPSAEETALVTRAAAMHDVDELARIRAAEEAGWARPKVLSQVDEALVGIEAAREYAARVLAEEQAAAKGKAK